MSQFGTFGRETKVSGKLHQMLNDANITPEQLFSIPYINGDMKQNIQTFLNFCRKNKQFTTRMLTICFNSTYEELEDEAVKKVAAHTIQVLTNDDVSLTNFLFEDPQVKIVQEIQVMTEQQSTSNIQSQAQRLFGQLNSEKQQAPWQNQEDKFAKYEIVMLTLEQLRQEVKNQTCLGYVNKLYSSVLRKEGNQFLQFLKQKPIYLELLFQNLNYCPIATIIALTLSCEDKNNEYKYQGLKAQIFKRLLNYGFDNIENQLNYCGFMEAIQQILNTTKQSYFQFFEDFKRCANILVSEENLRKFVNLLMKSQKAFENASWYLELVLRRVNSETEQHDYYKPTNSEATMKFQHTFLFIELQQIVDIFSLAKNYGSKARSNYLSFLMNLLKNMKKNEIRVPIEIFKKIFAHYTQDKSHGIVKTSLFNLLKTICRGFNDKQPKQLAAWLLQEGVELQILNNLFSDMVYSKINSNVNSCFALGLLFEVQNKQNTFLENFATKNDYGYLQAIYDKYYTKMALDEDASSPLYSDLDPNFKYQVKNKYANFFNISQNSGIKIGQQQIKEQPEQNEKQGQTQTVGKNSVVIPALNLPNKSQNNFKITIEEEQVQQVRVPTTAQLSREALIRELKNTKFDLPLKFKKTASSEIKQIKPKIQAKTQQPEQSKNQEQVRVEVKAQQPLSLKKQEQPNIEIKTQASVTEKKETTFLIESKQKKHNPEQQKYFVRHMKLF